MNAEQKRLDEAREKSVLNRNPKQPCVAGSDAVFDNFL
jgi:hypothetical protein